jgi:hypothetical protein
MTKNGMTHGITCPKCKKRCIIPILNHAQYLPSLHHYTICPYAKDIIDELKVVMQMKPTPLIQKTPTYIHVTLCSTSYHMLPTNYAQTKEKMSR